MGSGPKLTPEQRDRIITDRLGGASVRAICRAYGHSSRTVVAVYREHCAEFGRELSANLAASHAEQVLEAQRVADWARQEAVKYQQRIEDGKVVQEGNPTAFARLLGLELQAQRHLARLTGAEAAVKVDVSGQVDVRVTVEERRERVKARLVALCQSNN